MNLATNPESSVDMGQAGRKYMVENFTPKIIARQYCDVLNVNAMEQYNNSQSTESKRAIEDTLISEI